MIKKIRISLFPVSGESLRKNVGLKVTFENSRRGHLRTGGRAWAGALKWER